MSAPPIVWIDERIARGLPQAKDEELAERGVDQICYVAQERVNELVRAAGGPEELIIQIQEVGGILHGLTNHGRLMAYSQPLGIQDQLNVSDLPPGEPGWYEVGGMTLPEFAP